MLSEGEQAGFEATILRADGTKFNEYNVKHTVNEEGCKVTECYLECEDDAVYKIKIERTLRDMKRFQESQWSAVGHVDGGRLNGTAWDDPQKPMIFTSIFTAEPGPSTVYKIGRLTFAAAVVTSTGVDDSEETGPSSALGTISVTLTPGLVKLCGQRRILPRTSLTLESTKKLARVTKSTGDRIVDDKEVQVYKLTPHHPHHWQIFVFKYRHRAELEIMGVIDAPLPTPPRHATSQNQTKAGKKSNDQDQKPEVKPEVGADTPQAPRIFTVLDDSDESDEDESPEEEAARMEAIRKHREAIELLEEAGHDKGKGKGKKKVDMEEDEHVVKVEGSRTRIKLEKDHEVVHSVDSD